VNPLGLEEGSESDPTDLNPRSGSCRIMSLTSYQAAPPRVFEELDNALSGIFTQPFLKKIFELKSSVITG
jgi:hypothetical protein